MLGDQNLSLTERNQLLMQTVARNMQARRRYQQIPGLGLLQNSQRVWAIAREAAREARSRQVQARHVHARAGGTDILA